MWMLGVVSRFSGLPPFDVLATQGVLNGALLLGALYAFVATWVRRTSAAVYALLFVLFLWGPDPWLFSGFFHLGSLALVLPYPSTFAAALAFGSLAAVTRLATAPPWLWAPPTALVLAFLWILHPVNGLFLCLGLTAWSLERRRPVGHWLALLASFALSVGLALAWPLYPVGGLWFGQIGFVHAGN